MKKEEWIVTIIDSPFVKDADIHHQVFTEAYTKHSAVKNAIDQIEKELKTTLPDRIYVGVENLSQVTFH